jgi:ribulose-phosphate 3-epimerase
MTISISPSLLAADMGNLERELNTAENNEIQFLHIDVMDGNFVPNIAFGPDQVRLLRPLSKLYFDVHMMVANPNQYIQAFVDGGAEGITLHAESCLHLHRSIQLIKSLGKKVGIALNPATSLECLRYVYSTLDLVLIMTVNPGYGGQKYITDMNQKIKDLSEIKQAGNYKFDIQVDGGINLYNILDVIQAGATNIVIGSALFQKDRTQQNIQAFKEIISTAAM